MRISELKRLTDKYLAPIGGRFGIMGWNLKAMFGEVKPTGLYRVDLDGTNPECLALITLDEQLILNEDQLIEALVRAAISIVLWPYRENLNQRLMPDWVGTVAADIEKPIVDQLYSTWLSLGGSAQLKAEAETWGPGYQN